MHFNIVVLTYNRVFSLMRLINSLQSSYINSKVDLHVSIDGNAPKEILDYTKTIDWIYGDFNILERDKHLGPDLHNLECMKLALKFGSIIVLEDDLLLSPYFLEYLIQVLRAGLVDPNIKGVSLHRYPKNEYKFLPFTLLPNSEFVYYQQRPCSKGAYYTKNQIEEYVSFLEKADLNYSQYNLPENVKKWDDIIWEKSFYCFLQEKRGYMIFPRYSLSTDMGDFGVHMKSRGDKTKHQSNLYISSNFNQLKRFCESFNIYDAFYEIRPETIKYFQKDLNKYDFELDIYGGKNLQDIEAKYLLSRKKSKLPIDQWARVLKPEINNIVFDQSGQYYTLALTSSFCDSENERLLFDDLFYYFTDVKLIILIRLKIMEIIARFFPNYLNK